VYLRDDEDEDDYDFAAKSAWSAAAAFIENYPTNEVDERCESTCPHGDQCTLPIGHDGGHNHRYCNCNEPNVDTHVEKDRATKSKVRPWTNQLVTVFDSGRYNHLILMLKTSVKWLGPEEWKVLGTLLERILNSIKELDRALNDMEKNDD
jgi:hypothetical protein